MDANSKDLMAWKNDFMKKFRNPILFVKSENLYSIIARTESEEKRGNPFCRLSKQKDSNGEFIITRCRKKVYRDKWRYIEGYKCSGTE
ncbi:hypothetical protein [Bacillus toyonensis]|uniref:hypothetical protein n=1 Tax=Bacillus toyonensis TaxID=155322 RepID=UPI002AA577E0